MKNCILCGCAMPGASKRKRYCAECMRRKNNDWAQSFRDRKRAEKRAEERARTFTGKTLAQCVVEARQAGISYGEYVRRGLDKVV